MKKWEWLHMNIAHYNTRSDIVRIHLLHSWGFLGVVSCVVFVLSHSGSSYIPQCPLYALEGHGRGFPLISIGVELPFLGTGSLKLPVVVFVGFQEWLRFYVFFFMVIFYSSAVLPWIWILTYLHCILMLSTDYFWHWSILVTMCLSHYLAALNHANFLYSL